MKKYNKGDIYNSSCLATIAFNSINFFFDVHCHPKFHSSSFICVNTLQFEFDTLGSTARLQCLSPITILTFTVRFDGQQRPPSPAPANHRPACACCTSSPPHQHPPPDPTPSFYPPLLLVNTLMARRGRHNIPLHGAVLCFQSNSLQSILHFLMFRITLGSILLWNAIVTAFQLISWHFKILW